MFAVRLLTLVLNAGCTPIRKLLSSLQLGVRFLLLKFQLLLHAPSAGALHADLAGLPPVNGCSAAAG